MRPRITRRQFTALGGAAIASPFLRMLGGGMPKAYGAEGDAAKRLVVFFTPNGTIHDHWRPSGSGRSFTFPSGSILEPLAPHRDQLIVLEGIDFYVGTSNHEGGMAAMLTGGGGAGSLTGGASVDQYVASQLGRDTRFSSLELGVQTSAWGGNVQTRMSYVDAGTYAPPDDDPSSVYRRIFGDVTGEPQEVDRVLQRRSSILDLCLDELNGLSTRVGAEERIKLEQHMDAIRSVEVGLVATPTTPTGECTAPTIASLNTQDNDAFPDIGRAQMDLLVASLICDATRVASIQWSHTVGPVVMSWVGASDGHHSLSHYDPSNPAGVADYVACERWFASQFAYLLDRLAALPEPDADGSMLDHTLVLWAQELGDGRLHECISVPFVLAGGAGGYLSPGQYIDYGSEPHQKLLVSVCQAMGLGNQTFGDASFGAGPLAGLTA